MGTISTLTVDLRANTAEFAKSLQKGAKAAKSFAQKARAAITGFAKAMAKALAASVAGLATLIVKTAALGDKLAKMADSIGITTEALAGLQHAANITGVSAEAMAKNLQKMQKNIGDVLVKGTGEAEDALEKLGLTAEGLKNLPADMQLKAIAEGMKGVSSRTEQMSIAMGLFGRQGAAMLNMLDLGADGISAMQEEADKLGLTLTRIDTAKMEMMNDNVTRSKAVFQGFANQLTTQFSPIISGLANDFVEWAKETNFAGKAAEKVFNFVMKGAMMTADAINGLKVVWAGVKVAASGFAAVTAKAFQFLINDVFVEFGNKLRSFVLAPLETAAGALAPFSDTAKQVQVALGDLANLPRIQVLDDITAFAEKNLTQSIEEFNAALVRPVPSEAIKAKFEAYAQEAQAAAEKVAATVEARNSSLNTGDASAVPGRDFAKELESLESFLMTEEERIAASWERRQTMLNEALIAQQITQERHAEITKALAEKTQADLAGLGEKETEDKKKQNSLLVALDKAKFSESSKLGKAAMFARKVTAVKEALMEGKVAIAKAMSSAPPPANLAAVASAVAMTAANVASLQGIAHGGLDNVPREGTFLLDKGERVLSPAQNKDLTGFLANQGGAGIQSQPTTTTDVKVEPSVVVVDNEQKMFEALGSPEASDITLAQIEREPSKYRQALGV